MRLPILTAAVSTADDSAFPMVRQKSSVHVPVGKTRSGDGWYYYNS
jgi:hypothetical protein